MEQDGIKPLEDNNSQKDLLSKRRFGKYFLLLVFALSMLAFLYVIRMFVIDIIIAIMLATFFYPLFKGFLKILWHKRGVSAFFTCLFILLGLLIPLFFLSNVFIMQAIYLYHSGLPHLKHMIEKDIALFYRIKDSYIGALLETYGVDWQDAVTSGLNSIGANIAKLINVTSKTTFRLLLDLFVTLFSTFYFLKDGEIILGNIKDSIPLNDEYKNNIIKSFSMILNATVKGVLYVALLQSFLGTMTLWFFGVKAWLLLGGIMLVLAAIPFVGTGGVLVPVGILRIVNGHVGSGIAIIALSVLFISLIDNFIGRA